MKTASPKHSIGKTYPNAVIPKLSATIATERPATKNMESVVQTSILCLQGEQILIKVRNHITNAEDELLYLISKTASPTGCFFVSTALQCATTITVSVHMTIMVTGRIKPSNIWWPKCIQQTSSAPYPSGLSATETATGRTGSPIRNQQ